MNFSFKLISGIILLETNIEGKSGVIAFDTGAMHTALNSNYFKKEGKSRSAVKFNSATQESLAVETNIDVKVENYVIENISVIITDLNYVEKSLRTIDSNIIFLGSLGIDVIKEHNWKLDYQSKTLVMYDEIKENHKCIIDLGKEILPVADITIDQNNYKFIIDTGANTCLLDNRLTNMKIEPTKDNPNIVVIPKLELSGIKFNNIVAVLNDISAIIEVIKVNGIIGYQILKDFKCTFDFKNNKLYFD